MAQPKKYNLIPLLITFILIGALVYFIKPNKLLTYIRASVGEPTSILMYEVDKNSTDFNEKKSELGSFFIERGISGTAYEDKDNQYYVTLVPKAVNPKTEIEFGFVEVDPQEFYKKVYNTKQVYFTRTLKVIE